MGQTLSLEAKLFTETGAEVATVDQVAQAIYEKRNGDLNRAIGDRLISLFKSVHDFEANSILSEITEKPAFPAFLKGEDGQRYRVESFTVCMVSSFTIEPASLIHYVLGETQVTLATIKAATDEFSVMTVQAAGKPNEVKVHFEKTTDKT
jgi:hypothetical protein